MREATAALQSVFPQTELANFLSLSKRDKERQLIELTQIVTGIRLFNKECGKGGDGIDNLPGKACRHLYKKWPKAQVSLACSYSERGDPGHAERDPAADRRCHRRQ